MANSSSIQQASGESVNSGLDYWNGLLDWTTGLTFDLIFNQKYGQFCSSKRIIHSYLTFCDCYVASDCCVLVFYSVMVGYTCI